MKCSYVLCVEVNTIFPVVFHMVRSSCTYDIRFVIIKILTNGHVMVIDAVIHIYFYTTILFTRPRLAR
jgi:hypothetical protein